MKIALDARSLGPTAVGVGNYVVHLVEHFLRQGHKCLLLAPDDRNIPIFESPDQLEIIRVPSETNTTRKRFQVENELFQKLLAAQDFDLYHATDGRGVPDISQPTILTIHDIIPIQFPEYGDKKTARLYQKSVQLSIERTDHVITISEYTKRAVMEQFAVDQKRISVIPQGFYVADSDHVRRQDLGFSLPHNFILYVGGFAPRKNIFNMIRAYQQFIVRHPDGPHFVLVGKIGPGMKKEHARWQKFLRQHDLEKRVIFTGYLSDEQLAFIRSRAHLVLYVSLCEGFGLPIIEAMAQKIPVITSDMTAMPEIAGDAALLADPHDPRDIADKIGRIWSETGLAAQLVRAGVRRARQFSWKKTAGQTLSLYRKILH